VPLHLGVTADYLLCHFGKEGSGLFDFHESLLGVCLSPPAPPHAQESTSSLLLFSDFGGRFAD
jgi:hypothetical protein